MKDIAFDPDDARMTAAILRIPAFKPLGPARLAEVMTAISIRDYDKGETVIEQGARDQSMFFLLKGKLSIQVDGVEVGSLSKPHSVFGEMGVIDASPRSASAVARRPARCLVLDISFFDRLEGRAKLAVQAFFYKMFYGVLVERLRQTNDRIADLDMQKAVLENMEID